MIYTGLEVKMKRIWLPLVAAVIALAGNPIVAAGQDSIPDADKAAAVLREGMAKMWTLRLTGTAGEAIGRVTHINSTTVRLVGQSVPFSSIQHIERQKSSNSLVLPMAGVFGLLGAMTAGLGSSLCEGAGCSDGPSTIAIAGGAAAGAGLGALVGALIGNKKTEWVPIWP